MTIIKFIVSSYFWIGHEYQTINSDEDEMVYEVNINLESHMMHA